MNISGISSKSLLGKGLRFPLRFIPSNTVLPVLQGRLRGYKWVVGSHVHGCWLGSYEYKKQLFVVKTIASGTVVFDMGAHVGFYTLLFSDLVGPAGQVVAFEPLPRNVQCLKRHIRLNNLSNVTVIEAAVSDKGGTALFAESGSSATGHLSVFGQHQVLQVSIDELITAGEIPVPDYLKIDIEGAEYLALMGAKSILANHHPTIFLATHGCDVHERCCALLVELGYELKAVTDQDITQTDEIVAITP